jgi:peptidoglycan glycosyltransferase
VSKPIIRLFGLVVVLFGVLIAYTSWWTIFGAEGLNDNANNRRQLIEEARVERGRIRAADGTTLARSRPADAGTFTRFYPPPFRFSHEVGYSFIAPGTAGLERFYDDDLSGEEGDFESIVEQLEGRSRREGDDLRTHLDPDAQQVALDQLGGRPGSVVAIEPQTGNVRVMASVPGYDNNEMGTARGRKRIQSSDGSPLTNRSIAGLYPPGSTFKVVTAAAALDTGKYTPTTQVDGSNGRTFSGVPLNNFGGQDFGTVDFTFALTNSVNTVFAEAATDVGQETLTEYMRRFGFYKDPPIDLPRGERRPSGEYSDGELLPDDSDEIDVARLGIGQDKLLVTPLQMAIVVATIANGGVMVEPHIGERIVDPDGRTTRKITGKSGGRVISRQTAEQLADMMARVVQEGTGTAAALSGVNVAGKSGTAEVGGSNQPWFIAFAPVENPRIAVVATVERSDGTGGLVAAPIVKSVIEALL